jgi:hypothetical protein
MRNLTLCAANECGAPSQQMGIAQNPNGGLAGRPKAFRTSDAIAEDFFRQSLRSLRERLKRLFTKAAAA